MNAAEKLAARELLAKTRATHGWAFKDLPEAEVQAIRDFLLGDGPCPEDYTHTYALTCEQLGLPDPFKPEQFERNHAAIHEAAPGTCKSDRLYPRAISCWRRSASTEQGYRRWLRHHVRDSTAA